MVIVIKKINKSIKSKNYLIFNSKLVKNNHKFIRFIQLQHDALFIINNAPNLCQLCHSGLYRPSFLKIKTTTTTIRGHL